MSTHDAPTPLAQAEAAYAAGDFAAVRSATAAAVRDGTEPDKARALAFRIGVDPWCWAVLGISLALFCGIVAAHVR